jgi:hypothetical protein
VRKKLKQMPVLQSSCLEPKFDLKRKIKGRFVNSISRQFCSSRNCGRQGCQIFIDTMYQDGDKMYQMAKKLPTGHKICTPNSHNKFQMAIKIYQHFPFLGPQKYTQIVFLVQKYSIRQPCRSTKNVSLDEKNVKKTFSFLSQ